VAFLLPFASLYYGFSQQQRRETAEERAEQEVAEDFALRRKLARAEAAARRRAVQVGGMAAAVRAGVQAVRAGEPAAGLLGSDGSDGATSAEGASLTPAEEEAAEEQAAEEERRRPLGLVRPAVPQARRAETRRA